MTTLDLLPDATAMGPVMLRTATLSRLEHWYTAGVGLEAQATENVSSKAEYLYVDLGTQTYAGPLAGLGGIDATQRFSVIRAGINYKF